MEETWASGALELLRHAESHIQLDSAFDKRIAFISIDNSVETSIRTFLAMPSKLTGITIPRREIQDADKSFPELVTLLFRYASARLTGLDDGDIEHYHRIRNQLYHDGTGLSVDQRYLLAYRQIAGVLLHNLFGISRVAKSTQATLENLIVLWNEVETLVKSKLESKGIDVSHTYKWEMAIQAGVLSEDIIRQLTELRMIRNSQVHSRSDELNKQRIAFGVKLRVSGNL